MVYMVWVFYSELVEFQLWDCLLAPFEKGMRHTDLTTQIEAEGSFEKIKLLSSVVS